MDVLAYIPSFKVLSASLCDDWVDRLNHVHTVMAILVCAGVISTAQYVGAPIHCWIPKELNDKDGPSFKDYIHNYCWIKNTYYIPMYDVIPVNVEEREDEEITYYQWVPIILLIQAFLFKLPNLLWKMLHGYSGLNIDKLCKNARITQTMTPEDRKNAYEGLVFMLEKWTSVTQPYRFTRLARAKAKCAQLVPCCGHKRSGTYLSGLYICMKILYLGNVVGQLFLLNDFITTDTTSMYGFEWLMSYQTISPKFPRVTLCDFNVRQMANVQRYTMQCVLPINLFNEKVFLFLWFWLVIVAVSSLLSLLKWLYLLLMKRNNYEFVKKYLKICRGSLQSSDKKMCKTFAEEFLRDDGCFVGRMVSMNSSDMVVTDLFSDLFTRYQNTDKEKPETELENNEHTSNTIGNHIHSSGASGFR